MKRFLVISAGIALAQAKVSRDVPSGHTDAMEVVIQRALTKKQASGLLSHGCWCAGIESGFTGGSPVDELDKFCRDWINARKCLHLKGGSCKGTTDGYSVDNTGSCAGQSDCSEDMCLVDGHYSDLIRNYNWKSHTSVENADCELSTIVGGQVRECVGISPDVKIEVIHPCDVNAAGAAAALVNADPNSPFQVAPTFLGPIPQSGNLADLNGGIIIRAGSNSIANNGNRKKRQALPVSYDMRSSNWPYDATLCGTFASTVRDQGGCGTCWAFAAAGVVSDTMCRATEGRSKIYHSTMELGSCCSACTSAICDGGAPWAALQYFRDTGLVTGSDLNNNLGGGNTCYPYSMDGSGVNHFNSAGYHAAACSNSCTAPYPLSFSQDKRGASPAVTAVPLYHSADGRAVKEHIMNHGSVTMVYTVYNDFFQYTSGVYVQSSNDRAGNHVVKVVGWGVEGGLEYWQCVNSWGAAWGDNGTFKIKRGTANSENWFYGGLTIACSDGQFLDNFAKCVAAPTCNGVGNYHLMTGTYLEYAQTTNKFCKSLSDSSGLISIRVNNNSGGNVSFYWLDYNGNRVYYSSIGAGSYVIQQTYATHPWVLVNSSGIDLAIFTTPRSGFQQSYTLAIDASGNVTL